MRWLIFEPDGRGHRFWYVRLLAQEHMRNGNGVMLITRRGAEKSDEYRTQIEPLSDSNAAIRFIRGPEKTFRSFCALYYLIRVRILIHRFPGALILPDGDALLMPLLATSLLFSRVPVSILSMRPPGSGRSGRLKSLTIRRLSRRHNVRVLAAPLTTISPRTARDPVEFAVSIREKSRPCASWTLTVAGVIDRRKCVSELLTCCETLHLGLVLAGSLSDDVRRELLKPAAVSLAKERNLIVLDRYLSDPELNDWVARSDAVSALLNTRHGSSGILGRSVAAGIPVLGGGNRTVVDQIAATGIGVNAESLSIRHISEALVEIQSTRDQIVERISKLQGLLPSGTTFYSELKPTALI